MGKSAKFISAGLFAVVILCGVAASKVNTSDLWKKYDEAVGKGLPKTAIEALDPIFKDAIANKNYGEAVKAVSRKIVMEGHIQGNKPEEKIIRMQAEISKAPKELVPMLNTVLANWYWHYFQQNRWRFMNRTATSEAPGKDFTTWDLKRLFAEIDRVFQSALSDDKTLKSMPITAFEDLFDKNQKLELPDSYRPTLYDFIAYEALEFYTSGEQAAAKAQDAFEISADAGIFAPADKFMAWEPKTTDTDSPVLKAVKIYQGLLSFHRNDSDPSAFRDADLARLTFGVNVSVGEDKNQRYKQALIVAVDAFSGHELVSMAIYKLAAALKDEKNLAEAHRMAVKGAEAFPKSVGARHCKNLIIELEEPSLRISSEYVWNAPYPKIKATYRNISRLHFRAVAWDWEDFLQKQHQRPRHISTNDQKALLSKKPVHTWTEEVTPTSDFKTRIQSFPAPETLKPGFYFIIASYNEDFKPARESIAFTDVWVSELALVLRTRSGIIEGILTDARGGEPIAGAVVNAWYLEPNNSKRVSVPDAVTDADGCFSFKPPQHRGLLIRANHKDQQVANEDDVYTYDHGQRDRRDYRSVVFTDRAIYRPGQTIQFKGICVDVDPLNDNYEIMPKEKVTAILNDPNGKEVEKLELVSNDYGSFSGSFTAPRDRLMGYMNIQVRGRADGSAGVRVEEYKRPKFEVAIESPKEQFKLKGNVTVTGKAMAYTGAAIDGAKVKYRVTRVVRWPDWYFYCWRPFPNRGASQEISHGTVVTEPNGSFKVEFTAKPDLSVPASDEPIFDYMVSADVTDNAGETRSASRTISLAYTSMKASLNAKEWLTADKPVELTISTTTIDGEPLPATGSFKVYRLQEPDKVIRSEMANDGRYYHHNYGGDEPEEPKDMSNPNNWELADAVYTKEFVTEANGVTNKQFFLKAGLYRVALETKDSSGNIIKALKPLQVIDPSASKLGMKIANTVTAEKWSADVGTEFTQMWGTGYDSGRAYVEIEHRGKIIKKYWTDKGVTQVPIKVSVNDAMRGGFMVHVTQIAENRAYFSNHRIDVPWKRDLQVTWEHFTSKLMPGQQESWTAVIKGTNAVGAVAEMVATLYDQSLDAFAPLYWPGLNIFRNDYSHAQNQFLNTSKQFQQYYSLPSVGRIGIGPLYRQFPSELVNNFYGYGFARGSRRMAKGGGEGEMMLDAAMPMAACAEVALGSPAPMEEDSRASGAMYKKKSESKRDDSDAEAGQGGPGGSAAGDLNKVAARKNLNETAFFFPSLVSGTDGVVRITFVMPEALTKWKFMGFAHDKNLNSGMLTGEAVTSKDIMVQPNPPRFLREGDELELSVKVSNLSDAKQQGRLKLSLNDLQTGRPVDVELSVKSPEQDFDVPAKESRSYFWKIVVPDGAGFLSYKVVGSTGKLSDGEEGALPVLSRRIMVTESLPLPIRNAGTKKFEFEKLLKSGKSDTLKHQSLTVQMVSNPSWYAIMALPYLMEYPHECSEQTFNRLYANMLASHIAKSNPKIRRIFDQWKGTPALDSPLVKNQDLKSVMIEETPWLRDANDESQARRNVGILFDDNRLTSEMERGMQKLAEMQLGDGSWPWFPGGYRNDYITLYIVTGFGRMKHLGVNVDQGMALRAVDRLDKWIDETYRDILEHGNKDSNNLSSTIALYLYGRSFFLQDKPVGKANKEAFDYFVGQAKQHWLKLADRQSQAHLAVALKRIGDTATPVDIMKSIKERSVTNEELGMFWRELEFSWWWYRAPIETQAMMVEAFAEVMNDSAAVEDCKVWLLKQKQTQNWKTTKATADAVYALILRGTDNLASDALVEVSLAGEMVKPEKVEAGTGFYEKKFTPSEVKPKMGKIEVTKKDQGVSWGSVHWQYFEDMSKVTPHEGTPLKLKKAIYTKVDTKKGRELKPVRGSIKVGDELVVRVELRVDRDMEYVHLKDQRGSGVEPVNVLSQYKYQDGLAYYESTKDTASHFFIDYMPKGVYVFEYSVMVQHRGKYQTGIADIQCMYAPEFNSHSESFVLEVD